MTERTPVPPNARLLLSLLHAGDLDAAIRAGLMEWSAHPADTLDLAERAVLARTRARLYKAQQARERFCARKARLQRREQERRARGAASLLAHPPSSHHPAPALPAAAAAVLARARERAGIEPK